MDEQPTDSKRSWRGRVILVVLGVVVLGLLAMQFVPVDRSNPEVTMEVDAPEEVLAVLRESCFDCHSNETRWPWYSYVAPVSWFVAGHVDHGRQNLNFSEWDEYKSFQRRHWIREAYEQAQEGTMPLESYLRMHPEARLTAEDLEILREWAGAE
ncbi:MAG: heme-binding domain-containing protein [Phycisphaerales bacterium JB043]